MISIVFINKMIKEIFRENKKKKFFFFVTYNYNKKNKYFIIFNK